MLKTLLLPISLLFALATHQAAAQTTASKDVLKSRMAASVCDCLTKKSATKNPSQLSKEQVKQVFGQCFGAVAGKELNAIKAAYGPGAFGNSATMRTMGEEVGALLVQNCPESMNYFMVMADDHPAAASDPAATTTGQTTGRLGSLGGPGVTLLEVQTGSTGKVYFAWLRHFEHADELLGQLPTLQGRQARVSWQEVLVLQPDTHQYQQVREITGIELL